MIVYFWKSLDRVFAEITLGLGARGPLFAMQSAENSKCGDFIKPWVKKRRAQKTRQNCPRSFRTVVFLTISCTFKSASVLCASSVLRPSVQRPPSVLVRSKFCQVFTNLDRQLQALGSRPIKSFDDRRLLLTSGTLFAFTNFCPDAPCYVLVNLILMWTWSSE